MSYRGMKLAPAEVAEGNSGRMAGGEPVMLRGLLAENQACSF